MLLPLDVTRKAVFSPTELLHLPNQDSPTTRFLSRIAPPAIAASAGLYGVEGCYLQDVFGLVALLQPQAFKTRPVPVDVETRGELTRGATVCDVRWARRPSPTSIWPSMWTWASCGSSSSAHCRGSERKPSASRRVHPGGLTERRADALKFTHKF